MGHIAVMRSNLGLTRGRFRSPGPRAKINDTHNTEGDDTDAGRKPLDVSPILGHESSARLVAVAVPICGPIMIGTNRALLRRLSIGKNKARHSRRAPSLGRNMKLCVSIRLY
jgi:hypothetical protein